MPKALALLKAYEGVPYFNNARAGVRFGLRARAGKGTPEEIADEAQLAAFREHLDLAALSPEMRKKFLVEHKLGIDCSGFAYHILDAESQARGLGPLRKRLAFPYSNVLAHRLGRWLRRRYAENADVRTFAHPANSHQVPLSEIAPGDYFVRLKQGEGQRDHMILVTAVDSVTITLAQSVALPSDGRYKHGVRTETLPREALAKWGLPPLRPALKRGEVGQALHRLNWL